MQRLQAALFVLAGAMLCAPLAAETRSAVGLESLSLAHALPPPPTLPPLSAQEEHHEDHRNHVALFGGFMKQLAKDEEAASALGVVYERRLNPTWGVEGLLEYVEGDHARDWLAVVVATYRSSGNWKFGLGPGIEVADDSAGHGQDGHFLISLSALYSFRITERLSIAPVAHLDFVGKTGTNLTVGLSFGTGF